MEERTANAANGELSGAVTVPGTSGLGRTICGTGLADCEAAGAGAG
jgi:hypothetical protein